MLLFLALQPFKVGHFWKIRLKTVLKIGLNLFTNTFHRPRYKISQINQNIVQGFKNCHLFGYWAADRLNKMLYEFNVLEIWQLTILDPNFEIGVQTFNCKQNDILWNIMHFTNSEFHKKKDTLLGAGGKGLKALNIALNWIHSAFQSSDGHFIFLVREQ